MIASLLIYNEIEIPHQYRRDIKVQYDIKLFDTHVIYILISINVYKKYLGQLYFLTKEIKGNIVTR